MKIDSYLFFDGDCAEAFKFYAELLGGELTEASTYGDSPEAGETSEEMRDKVMHVGLDLGNHVLMGSDAPSERYNPPTGVNLVVNLDEPEEAERIFDALAKGGDVSMPLGETFWATRFGSVTDRFGIPWMVNCD